MKNSLEIFGGNFAVAASGSSAGESKAAHIFAPREDLTTLTDSALYKRAQNFGLLARQWLRKFEGLLPEIARRKLYKRRGCASIQEFAAKLAGMSHEKTDKILRLSEVLADKPTLKALLESGAVGYAKLERVAYISTPETDAMWAEKVINLPKVALELCVQEARRINRVEVTPGRNSQPEKMTLEFAGNSIAGVGAGTAASETKSAEMLGLAAKSFNILSIKVSAELEFELRLLKQKLEKQRGEALGFAEVLQELLKVYNAASGANSVAGGAVNYVNAGTNSSVKKPAASQKIIELCPNCIKEKENEKALFGVTQRAISQAVQDVVTVRQKNKCAVPACKNPPEIFHHTRRFSLHQNHDPDFIVHLCVPHERLVHAGLIENEEKNPSEWKIKIGGESTACDTAETYAIKIQGATACAPTEAQVRADKAKFKIDEKVNALRREPMLAISQ